jgi:hypothetical protein
LGKGITLLFVPDILNIEWHLTHIFRTIGNIDV